MIQVVDEDRPPRRPPQFSLGDFLLLFTLVALDAYAIVQVFKAAGLLGAILVTAIIPLPVLLFGVVGVVRRKSQFWLTYGWLIGFLLLMLMALLLTPRP